MWKYMNEQRAAAILIIMLVIGMLFLFACMMLTAQHQQPIYPDIITEANQLKIGTSKQPTK